MSKRKLWMFLHSGLIAVLIFSSLFFKPVNASTAVVKPGIAAVSQAVPQHSGTSPDSQRQFVSRNLGGGLQALPSESVSADLAAEGSPTTCGVYGNSDKIIFPTTTTYEIIRQCTMTVPQDGWVYISADASVGLYDLDYEAQFTIGIDSTSGDLTTERKVNIYDDGGSLPGYGSDKSTAITVLKPVTAGTHTFNFLGKQNTNTGTVLISDATLTVRFFPAGSSDVLTCGSANGTDWTTSLPSFVEIRQCSLNLPRPGWVFISADASVGRQTSDFKAQFTVGIDSTTGEPAANRTVNITLDSGDGTDKTAALSLLKQVPTDGSHTIYFLGKRSSAAGTVLVSDPTLTVLFFPDANSELVGCSSADGVDWQTTSTSFSIVRQCELTMDRDGWVYISANASLGRLNTDYEGQFEIGIDSTTGDPNIDRWVDVYTETNNTFGTDESMALSVLKPITAGTHTVYLLGLRSVDFGTGTVLVRAPTLSVLSLPVYKTFLPFVRK